MTPSSSLQLRDALYGVFFHARSQNSNPQAVAQVFDALSFITSNADEAMTEYERLSLQLQASIVRGLQLSLVQNGVYADPSARKNAHIAIRELVTEWQEQSSEVLGRLDPTIPTTDPPPFGIFHGDEGS